MKEYRLEFSHPPFQTPPSHVVEHLIEEEIQSLIQKQAVVKTIPKQEQFVSRMFLVKKKRRVLPPSNKFEVTQQLHMEMPLQDGRNKDAHRSASASELDELYQSKGCVPVSEHVRNTNSISTSHGWAAHTN